jgi:hypothetical protein
MQKFRAPAEQATKLTTDENYMAYFITCPDIYVGMTFKKQLSEALSLLVPIFGKHI